MAQNGTCAACEVDHRYLTSTVGKQFTAGAKRVTIVDLFAGCGGLTLGLAEAINEHGHGVEIRLAVDLDSEALAVYADNLPVRDAILGPVERLFDGELGSPRTVIERRLALRVGPVDYLVGGPPCQGSSALNNHTRHNDPRNALYARMARAAEVLRPSAILVENVPEIRSDANGVIDTTLDALNAAGYKCAEALINMERLGIPQRRKRHLLLALADGKDDPRELLRGLVPSCSVHVPRTIEWALAGLVPHEPLSFDAPADLSQANAQRIAWLFDNNSYDLPNSLRPRCHRSRHSYVSMYGRLHPDQPAQTITSGFMSMGQGRYVHPWKRRTLTPHEAARLQTFPDSFTFRRARTRRGLTSMIGNAVPPLANLLVGRRLLSRRAAQEDEKPAA